MKAALVLATSVVLSVATVTIADECHNICAGVNKGVNFKSGCSAFRNALPRPKVSSKCQSGFKAAVDRNCYDACVNGGRLPPYLSERRLDEACNGALKESPRPLCHDACVHGYRSGIKDMYTLLVQRMAEEASPAALAALKVDTVARQVAQNINVVATAASSTPVEDPVAESMGIAEPAVTAPSQRTDLGAPGKDLPGSAVKEGVVEDGAAVPAEHEEIQGLDESVEEHNYVRDVHEQYSVSTAEIEQVEDNSGFATETGSELNLPNDEVKAQVEEADHRDEADHDQDSYEWVEHINEVKLLLSLPITVDNVQQELAIFEGDEPLDVVVAFCRENMPEEGVACVDELIHVVQDQISPVMPPQKE